TDAVLAGADLARTSMRGADMSRANLGRTQCVQTDFTESRIKETIWDHANCEDCSFAGSVWLLGRLHQARLRGCDLSGASFEQWAAMMAAFEDCRFHQARLNQCVFMQGTMA
ncbi:pentapeptide repeat-containing protein, partial [Salmonella sp. 17E624]